MGSGWVGCWFANLGSRCGGRGPSPGRAGPPRSPVRFPGAPRLRLPSPRSPPRPKGTWWPALPGPRASPKRSHAARVLLSPAGGRRCSLAGPGGRRICSTLTTEVTFPAPGSGLASHTPGSPNPLSSCFLPLRGASVSLRPECTRGAALAAAGRSLLSSRGCLLSRRLLAARERCDEYRAVEQVVPKKRDTGKSLLFQGALGRKWASPGISQR